MLTAITLLFVLPALISTSEEGNIHLLGDEVSSALHACSYNETTVPKRNRGSDRQRRSDNYNHQNQQDNRNHRIDKTKEGSHSNLYDHKRCNSIKKVYVYNGTGNNTHYYDRTSTATIPDEAKRYNISRWTRIKRVNPLIIKTDQDKCLSQCVFVNLQVVDARGIPREAELWNKVQIVVTSHQSRILLKDQIRACFQELESESEDDDCSYSNSLERCLMLRFSDRKLN